MSHLEQEIAREHNRWTIFPGHRSEDEQGEWPLASTAVNGTPGQLKHSPGCDNLAAFSDRDPAKAQDRSWTPPATPGSRRDQSTSEIMGATSTGRRCVLLAR